jgi:hypothetical protein
VAGLGWAHRAEVWLFISLPFRSDSPPVPSKFFTLEFSVILGTQAETARLRRSGRQVIILILSGKTFHQKKDLRKKGKVAMKALAEVWLEGRA